MLEDRASVLESKRNEEEAELDRWAKGNLPPTRPREQLTKGPTRGLSSFLPVFFVDVFFPGVFRCYFLS